MPPAGVLSATRGPICIAHRGASGVEPENTLRSFARALEQGANWIELDVHVCEDRLVVMHDETVDRTTNGRGRISDLSLATLRALDAGQGEKVPFLDEVLALVDHRAIVNVELKGDATAAATVAVLARVLAEPGWQPGHFVVSSFYWDWLRDVRAMDPRLPVAPLATGREGPDILDVAARLDARAIHVDKWAARSGFVRDAHARRLAVRVYTINERWELELMRRLGVDAVFTDYPDRALAWVQQRPWAGSAH